VLEQSPSRATSDSYSPSEHRLKQLQIDLDRSSADSACLALFPVLDTAGEALLCERELILLSQTADITVLTEKTDKDIGVTFCFFLRTLSVVEERDALCFVPVPQGAQGKHIGRRDFFVS
jgi:hypothetical protein